MALRLGEEGSQASRRLRDRITQGIPRFEASEEVRLRNSIQIDPPTHDIDFRQKRKRRDYRNARKAQFTRPELGFSLYEGRTRGKRVRYTFSDEEEEEASDVPSARRSNRQSGGSTPVEPVGPTFTASGRQVRSRVGGAYGESMLSGQHESPETAIVHGIEISEEPVTTGRTRGTAPQNKAIHKARSRKHIEGYNSLDEMEDESDASSSGVDWDAADDEEVDERIADDEDEEDVDMSDDDASVENEEVDVKGDVYIQPSSLVVALRYQKKNAPQLVDSSSPATSKQLADHSESSILSSTINASRSIATSETKNPRQSHYYPRPVEDHLLEIS